MYNKLVKILSISFIALMVLAMTTVPVFAADYLDPNSIKAEDIGNTAETAQKIAGAILAIVQVIGVSVAVIMLIVLAIKYISAAPNDKAEIKKHAVVYIVGAVVLFAASGILGIIRSFAKEIKPKETSRLVDKEIITLG